MHAKRLIRLLPLALLALGGCATPDEPVMREAEIAALTAANLTERHSFDSGDCVLRYRMHAPRARFLRRYPLVLLLHGSGERGGDNDAQLRHGATQICRYALRHGDAYVVVPQCPPDDVWSAADWSKSEMTRSPRPTRTMAAVLALVDDLVRRFPVDKDRIYVTGLSMGGYGAWDAPTRRPGLFAGILPICGGVDEKTAEMYRGMNIRFVHGAEDPAVSVEYSRRMHRALDALGIRHAYMEYPGVGHDSWSRAYGDDRVLAWLFACRR